VNAIRPLSLLAPVATAAALFIAGCGGSGGVSKDDYVKSLNQAVATLQKSTASLGPAATSGGDAAKRLDDGSKAMDVAAENFSNITPPDDAKHAHDQMVDGLHKFADTMRDAADAARAKDQDKLLKVLTEIDSSAGAKELQAATEELTAKGYNVQ
jgi:uncharacterized protein YukE